MAPSNKMFSRHKRISERRRTLSSMRDSKYRFLPPYFGTERKKNVLNALVSIEADVTFGKPIRWKNLLPAVRKMILSDETAPGRLNFLKELLGLYERYHCRDMSLLSEVFTGLLFVSQPDHAYLRAYKRESEKFFCYPYGKAEADIDLVWRAVSGGNLGFLKLQLKFGMGMILPYSSPYVSHIVSLFENWLFTSDDDIRGVESTADYHIYVKNGIAKGFQITKIGEEAIKKNLSCNFNPETRKRLCLVLRMLELVLQIKFCRPDCREHFFDCYKLLFDFIPAAFVTSVEVKTTLEKCLPVSCSRFISIITENFKKFLPELAEMPQPRSLKHLCRVEVRQNLRRNLNLPHGVSSLPLPSSLKQYIMLNDDGDYSFIINDSLLYDKRAEMYSRQDLYINIPERDDWVTSFIKNL